MDEALIDLLRADLEAAEYLPSAAAMLWGEAAEGARERGLLMPARRALRQRTSTTHTPRSLLAAVFLLGEAITEQQAGLALPRLGLEGARELGLLQATVDGDRGDAGSMWRAALSLQAVDPLLLHAASIELASASAAPREPAWWILSDLDDQLRTGAARPDHVMGVGGATRSLLAQVPWGQGNSMAADEPGLDRATQVALDLGTGCGVVAMCLAHAGFGRVVASDISERAIMLARANARLNHIGEEFGSGKIEWRIGSLFDPVAGERFDLILSNPPFVISPQPDDPQPRYEYRDGGMVGDALTRIVVQCAPGHLRDGGTLICLANWETPWGGNGLDRVRGWITETAETNGPLAAWVIERDRLDPVRYAETWARDGGARHGSADFEALVAAWLDDFDGRNVVEIGLGSIRLQRIGEASALERGAMIRAEHAPEPFATQPGLALDATFTAAVRTEQLSDEQILASRWRRRAWVREQREYTPGAESPNAIMLTTDAPLARTVQADPMLAAAIGACDGELTLEQIADALATLLEIDAEHTAAALVEGVRELVWLGMLQAA